jgi:hypothetical protein
MITLHWLYIDCIDSHVVPKNAKKRMKNFIRDEAPGNKNPLFSNWTANILIILYKASWHFQLRWIEKGDAPCFAPMSEKKN